MALRGLVGDQLQLVQVAVGLGLGTAARYAMRLQDRLPITWREVLADVLLLGFNALLTMWAVDKLGTTGKGAVLTAALFGVGQDRVVRLARKWFERRGEKMLAAAGLGDDKPEAPALVPPVKLPPTVPAEPDDALTPARAPLRDLYGRKPKRPPADMIEQLKKLDEE